MASQNKYKQGASSPGADGFGPFLRRLRLERDLPLREVAAAIGMDQAHLSKAELGQRLPTAGQTTALARYFKQELVEFEAHRIAEKFRQKHAGSPAATRAIHILHQGQVPTSTRAKEISSVPLPAPSLPVEDKSVEDRSVMILHAD